MLSGAEKRKRRRRYQGGEGETEKEEGREEWWDLMTTIRLALIVSQREGVRQEEGRPAFFKKTY